MWSLALGGWFPGGEVEAGPTGGRRRVWTGKALIAASKTAPPPLDHDRYSSSTLWRLGCGCDTCLAWHNNDTRERRRKVADNAFPEEARSQLLELIASNSVASIEEAAERVKVRPGQVYGRARRDPAFREALEEAAHSLCIGIQQCGRPAGYRNGCRGTACRRAHRPLTS